MSDPGMDTSLWSYVCGIASGIFIRQAIYQIKEIVQLRRQLKELDKQ